MLAARASVALKTTASGKSLVADQMRALGGVVLDADLAGHEVLRDQEVIDALHERWGDGIVALDGSLSRSVIAKIVFSAGNQEEKRYLESVAHPRIAARIQRGERIADLVAQIRISDAGA